jgi:hypothetical protein
VFGVRLAMPPLKLPVPPCDPRLVVAMTVERSDAVPYAKPEPVIEAPPVAEMLAFRVTVEVETRVGREVVRVGMAIHGLVVVLTSEL